jgi:hypothetical protein
LAAKPEYGIYRIFMQFPLLGAIFVRGISQNTLIMKTKKVQAEKGFGPLFAMPRFLEEPPSSH